MPVSVITEEDFVPMPASEAARHFAAKAQVTSDEFERLSKAAKEKAFRILNVNKARLIQAARDLIKQGIESGSDYGQTIRSVSDMLASEGEAGPSIARLRQTYLHHAHRAYAAAHWDAITDADVADAFPYLMYRSLGDTSVRATHAALDGLVFRRDDPFWLRFKPPWEFGCRCYVDPVSAEEVESKSIELATDDYVRNRLPVGEQRGVQPNENFNLDGDEDFDLSSLDDELRQAVERTLQTNTQEAMTESTERWSLDLIPIAAQKTNEPLARVMLSPDGKVKTDRGHYFFDEESYRAILAYWSQRTVEPVIDFEHQSVTGEKAPAAGWIKGFDYEPGEGFFGHIAWTDEATQLIRTQSYRYLSPVLDIRKTDRKAIGFHSAGITNTPAILNIAPLVAKDNFSDMEVLDMNEKQLREMKAALRGLGVAVEEHADADTVILACKQAQPGATGKDVDIAVHVRGVLGLPATANKDAVVVALSQLKGQIGELEAMRADIETMKATEKARATDDRMERAFKGGRLLRDTEEAATYRSLAESDPAMFDKMIASKRPIVPTGTTIPPSGSVGSTSGEDGMITEALKQHGGDKMKAMTALQERILKSEDFAGMDKQTQWSTAGERYPKIFA